MGMIGVDKIGQIRRAFFERHLPTKEIVRTLSVSRATVRKVIRGKATEFRYERGVQPAPKLGEWVEVLTEILEKEARLPRRERRSTQRLFEELRGRGYDKGWRRGYDATKRDGDISRPRPAADARVTPARERLLINRAASEHPYFEPNLPIGRRGFFRPQNEKHSKR